MGKPELSDLIGKHFMDGGRNVLTGLDCWGLVMEVFKRYGVTIPDFYVGAFDFRAIDKLAHEATGFKAWEVVGRPDSGDAPLVVLMRMHPGLITHAGVWIGHGRIIHTMKGTGVIISKVWALKSRIAGYYRFVQDN